MKIFDDLFIRISNKYGFLNNPNKLKIKEIPFIYEIKGVFFKIIGGYCNCDSPIGRKSYKEDELFDYLNWLKGLKKHKKIKYIYILQYWNEKKKRSIEKIIVNNIDDIDISFLTDIKENTFYRIEYFKRYDNM